MLRIASEAVEIALGATVPRFVIDSSSPEGVYGWVVSSRGLREIRVLVEGRIVARGEPDHGPPGRAGRVPR